MTSDAAGTPIPDPGQVTPSNAYDKLSEQLAAVATLSSGSDGGLPEWKVDDEKLPYWGPGPATGLPAKISDAVTKLTHNLKEITAKLPDVDSYTVQAGFPFGVSVRYHQLLKRRDWRKLAAAAAPRTHAHNGGDRAAAGDGANNISDAA